MWLVIIFIFQNLKEIQENIDQALLTEVHDTEGFENGRGRSRSQSISTQTVDNLFDGAGKVFN